MKGLKALLFAGIVAAFATSAQAAVVHTAVGFDVTSSGVQSTGIDITYSGVTLPPVGPGVYTVTNTGGLTGITFAVLAGNVLDINWDPTYSTPGGSGAKAFQFDFTGGVTPPLLVSYTLLPGFASSDVGVAVTSVPEPTSMAMLGIGLTGLLTIRRFRKRSA